MQGAFQFSLKHNARMLSNYIILFKLTCCSVVLMCIREMIYYKSYRCHARTRAAAFSRMFR